MRVGSATEVVPSATAWSVTVAGAIAFALGTACIASGTFVAGERKQEQVDAFPALVVFAAIVTALVFWFLVRPAIQGIAPARPLLLGGIAVVSVAAFFTGMPVIFGAASLVVSRTAAPAWTRTLARALAVVAIGANALLAVVG